MFEPGNYVRRADEAARTFLNDHGRENEINLDATIDGIKSIGLLATITSCQDKLRQAGTVLAEESVRLTFDYDPEFDPAPG